ncbi:ureidoglycolate hydrolase [Tanacetum coccineum]
MEPVVKLKPIDAQLDLSQGTPRFYIMHLQDRALEFSKITHHSSSWSGHFFMPHAVEIVQVFKISGAKFLKLNRGTWHAGPLFKPVTTMDFYNTNVNSSLYKTINRPTDGGVTALHMAALNGHVDSLQLL